MNGRQLDFAALRVQLADQHGPAFWRSLDELAETPEFQDMLHREFPEGAAECKDDVSRRNFLKLMGASLALAGQYGCTRGPDQKIVPYVDPPEAVVPGKSLYFATAMPLNGIGTGVLVESHMGRPTKVEGNPDHPASLGATDPFAQSSVLQLYDPDRSRVFTNRGNVSDWGGFINNLQPRLAELATKGGAGLRILTETITSPTAADLMRQVLAKYPQAKWHQYEPIGRENVLEGARLAFGQAVTPVYRFDQAKVILSLDCDFLYSEPGHVRYAHDFMNARRVRDGRQEMNRLYVAEPTPSITGSMADHRLPLAARNVEAYARAVATALGANLGNAAHASVGQAPAGVPAKWVSAVADDLRAHRGAALVVAGQWQPPAVHALAHAMNEALGSVGKAVVYADPPEATPVDGAESLRELTRDLGSGAVEMLLILGGNPVYTAPADLDFGRALLDFAGVRNPDGSLRHFTAHLSLYDDETSYVCQWRLPCSHFLEGWGDVRAYDGTVSIIQPLIAPLYRSKTDLEVLALLLGRIDVTPHGLVRAYWQEKAGEGGFEDKWERWLERGVVADSAMPARDVRVQAGGARTNSRTSDTGPATPTGEAAGGEARGGVELVFRPDPTIWDGSFSNVGWQQELPKPFTKITWGNAAIISPKLAERNGLVNGDVVTIACGKMRVDAPVWILPGQAENSVTVHLGYGRTLAGGLGTNLGFNAYTLRTSNAAWFAPNVTIQKTGARTVLAVTSQFHTINSRAISDRATAEVIQKAPGSQPAGEISALENRRLIRTATLEQFRKNPDFVKQMEEHAPAGALPEGSAEGQATPGPRGDIALPTLLPPVKYEGYKWGMSIDIHSCIGCNACVVACQAENNIPVVGRDQVSRGRAMHWLRVDQYFGGELDNPEVYNEPIPCMHCENAPCELVCPVGATVHDSEGINNMVYNRCVGTRYCSNNCPYKVRRFNWYLYSDYDNPTIKMQKNPNVTVRARGVMEKCTYCIQRVAEGRIEAEKQNTRIRDGQVQTACQQACPTQAIIFGDLNDPNSYVTRLKASPLDYGLLTELTTLPRTTYLARIRNPNPKLETA
jgi:MoCo/4Fe-4S cofactor protein with predicted Tat translocation signal